MLPELYHHGYPLLLISLFLLMPLSWIWKVNTYLTFMENVFGCIAFCFFCYEWQPGPVVELCSEVRFQPLWSFTGNRPSSVWMFVNKQTNNKNTYRVIINLYTKICLQGGQVSMYSHNFSVHFVLSWLPCPLSLLSFFV